MSGWTRVGAAATVVNGLAMGLAYVTSDWRIFAISWAGAAFSGYGTMFIAEGAGMGTEGFRSIAMRLRYEITEESGWTPGQRLPSLGDLGRRFGSSRTTIKKALALLAEEGLIVTLPGRGSFVRGGVRTDRRRDEVEQHLRDQAAYREDLGTAEYLAVALGVSPSTVRRVLRGLIEEGLVRRQADGRYVRA